MGELWGLGGYDGFGWDVQWVYGEGVMGLWMCVRGFCVSVMDL